MRTTTVLHAVESVPRTHELAGPDAPARVSQRCATLCGACNLRELCLPAGLEAQEMDQLARIVHHKHPVKRGEYLYRAGSELQSLYAVRTGFLKSCVLHDDGREQVAGFHMMGELLGMDAIGSGRHMCDAIALEDSEMCDIPYNEFEHLSRDLPGLQRHFHRVMSREITRDYGVMLLLGSMRAEERLAAFLLNLSQRFAARGYSSTQFNLRMTREEIGSYLGLKLETVSRSFSHFQSADIVAVHNKAIELKDLQRLRAIVGLGAGH